jgi:hypothetical protein
VRFPSKFLISIFVRETFGGWVASSGRKRREDFAVPIFAIGAHALSYPGAGRYVSRWSDVNKVGVSALTRPPGRLPGNGRSIHRLSFSTPKKDY